MRIGRKDLTGIKLEVVDSAKEFATKPLVKEIDCVMPHREEQT